MTPETEEDKLALFKANLANELEEMRIDLHIDVGLCVDERYKDYCGRIINQQFKELIKKLNLPSHTSSTSRDLVEGWLKIGSETEDQ